jgi:hypothetical protein
MSAHPGGSRPVRVLSPISDDDAELLEDSGIETLDEFLDNSNAVSQFLRDDEFESALQEAQMLTGGPDITGEAYRTHAEWHDQLVEGGHDPVTEIVSADDIQQPAGRPRSDKDISEQVNIEQSTLEKLHEAGYTTGSQFNGLAPEAVAEHTGLSVDAARRIIEQCRTHYHGLPVLEDNGHPLIPDRDTYREIWTRRTLTGAEDVVDVCHGAAQDQYPMCLVGYPGVGKSYLIAHICAMTNRPLLSIDMDSSLRAEDLLGFHVPEDGNSISFKYGIFPIAFRYGIWLNINELPAADAFAGHGASNEASNSRWEEIWIVVGIGIISDETSMEHV